MDLYESLLPVLGEEEVASLKKSRDLPVVHGLYLHADKLSESDLLFHFPLLRKHPIVPNAFYYFEGEMEPGKDMLHALGCYYLMDPASMVAPYFLNPKPTERILDFCAAPGGKTCLLSLLSNQESLILSNDLSYTRALTISQNVERLGLRNVAVVSGDFAKAKDAYEGYFDAILLDAPCSGSAMFRKDARLEEDWTEEKVSRCAATQAELLDIAAQMLAPGGRILYSTCSFSYEEDEGAVLSFLQRHKDFHLTQTIDDPSFYHHKDAPLTTRLLPHHFPCEGQFIALLTRDGPSSGRIKDKETKIEAESMKIASSLGYGNSSLLRIQDALFALPEPIKVHGLSLLRYGVKLGTFQKGRFEPDHAYAIASREGFRPVDEEKARRYLSGETIPLDADDGYHVIAYRNIPLGLVKVVHGIAKNHYPKGLRRKY